ncbi:MAG: hypothetical protein ACI9DG_001749, partial [Oleispira sp.]
QRFVKNGHIAGYCNNWNWYPVVGNSLLNDKHSCHR